MAQLPVRCTEIGIDSWGGRRIGYNWVEALEIIFSFEYTGWNVFQDLYSEYKFGSIVFEDISLLEIIIRRYF